MSGELLKEKHLCGYHIGSYASYVEEYGNSYAFTAFCRAEEECEKMLFVERWTGTQDWDTTELDCMVTIVTAAHDHL